MLVKVIVTVPPYAGYLEELARHPLVEGFRLNTVMPLRETPVQVLERLSQFGKPLWVDLKGRQLRVVGAAIPPYSEVVLSHPIRVQTPVNAYFSDGMECVRVAAVDGARLILADGPHRLVGPGESVNIIHPSLEIEGTLTDLDLSYLSAMRQAGMKRVMLSYVEKPEDVPEVEALLTGAEVILKIETERGLNFARKYKSSLGRLMAARGDLYVEVLHPHRMIGALREIITADPTAIAASRLFESLVQHAVPASADLTDAAFLIQLGYRTFLLGDAVCFQRETVLEALNVLQAVAGQF